MKKTERKKKTNRIHERGRGRRRRPSWYTQNPNLRAVFLVDMRINDASDDVTYTQQDKRWRAVK